MPVFITREHRAIMNDGVLITQDPPLPPSPVDGVNKYGP